MFASSDNAATYYRTVTGRSLNLSGLGSGERALLRQALSEFKHAPAWTAFARGWRDLSRRLRLPHNSVAYRVCEDLEARLGISTDRMATPDYRDFINNLIHERYRSRSEFCAATGIDKGHLSRVLAGQADLSLAALLRVFEALGLVLWARTWEEVRAAAASPMVSLLADAVAREGESGSETPKKQLSGTGDVTSLSTESVGEAMEAAIRPQPAEREPAHPDPVLQDLTFIRDFFATDPPDASREDECGRAISRVKSLCMKYIGSSRFRGSLTRREIDDLADDVVVRLLADFREGGMNEPEEAIQRMRRYAEQDRKAAKREKARAANGVASSEASTSRPPSASYVQLQARRVVDRILDAVPEALSRLSDQDHDAVVAAYGLDALGFDPRLKQCDYPSKSAEEKARQRALVRMTAQLRRVLADEGRILRRLGRVATVAELADAARELSGTFPANRGRIEQLVLAERVRIEGGRSALGLSSQSSVLIVSEAVRVVAEKGFAQAFKNYSRT